MDKTKKNKKSDFVIITKKDLERESEVKTYVDVQEPNKSIYQQVCDYLKPSYNDFYYTYIYPITTDWIDPFFKEKKMQKHINN